MKIEQSEICCCVCGVTFWVTKQHDDELSKCCNSFWCPNGHKQHFTGKSDAQKYKEERQRNEQLNRNNERLAQDVETLVRSQSALRGVITRMKKKREKP